MNWDQRLKPGQPPLRPGELAILTGWSYPSIRKLIEAGAIKSVRLIVGGERRVPVSEAREIAVRLEVIAA